MSRDQHGQRADHTASTGRSPRFAHSRSETHSPNCRTTEAHVNSEINLFSGASELELLTSSMPWWPRQRRRRAASVVSESTEAPALPPLFRPGAPQFALMRRGSWSSYATTTLRPGWLRKAV